MTGMIGGRIGRRTFLVGGVGAGLSALAAPSLVRAQSARPDEVSVGVLLALTGPAAAFGNSAKAAIDIAVAHVNEAGGLWGGGKGKIKLVVHDDQSKPEIAVSELAQIARQADISVLASVTTSASTMQASIEAERQKIPYANLAGAAKEVNERGLRYTFTTCNNTDGYLKSYLAQTNEIVKASGKKPQKVAFVHENKFVGPSYKRAWDEHFKATVDWTDGGQYPYDPATSDFGPLVARLKADNIDFPIVSGYPQDTILLLRAMREQDYNPLAISGIDGGFSTVQFLDAVGASAEYVMGWSPFLHNLGVPGNKEFVDEYRAKAGKTPEPIAGLGFNGFNAVLAALRGASNAMDRESVHQSFATLDLKAGEQGLIIPAGVKFNEKGANPMVVGGYYQIRDGVHRAVLPREFSSIEPVYPRPQWSEIKK